MEELSQVEGYSAIEESSPLKDRFDTELMAYSAWWGQDFFLHKLDNPQKNYFVE
jgi:hypothetical protein